MTGTPDQLRVLVADASPFFRDTLRDVLQGADDIDVVAVAGTADDAIRLAEQHLPDVAVVDVHLSGDGLHAIRRIHQRVPAIRLVALCGFIDAPSESELAELGVVEYVIKGVPNRRIIAAIHRAAEENADR
ncbi:response regulator transcription factor [Lentzea sp. NBC_00516]|uniref:Response regulator transcription factor n=1 Tax=Lentzea sokolovensis TaxID=3095429 RepID=A0ABU4UQP0_9PSEU|nr:MULTISPECIES: response regulator transcription factor [unclassified Lentzea]MDX8141482.1 response regulator transcription factor [Lentzea sp. BCCO 10_0061]WUD27305.1 response regulator transcription factor [Lentzea sp. NBC_00516]